MAAHRAVYFICGGLALGKLQFFRERRELHKHHGPALVFDILPRIERYGDGFPFWGSSVARYVAQNDYKFSNDICSNRLLTAFCTSWPARFLSSLNADVRFLSDAALQFLFSSHILFACCSVGMMCPCSSRKFVLRWLAACAVFDRRVSQLIGLRAIRWLWV